MLGTPQVQKIINYFQVLVENGIGSSLFYSLLTLYTCTNKIVYLFRMLFKMVLIKNMLTKAKPVKLPSQTLHY